MDGPPTHYIRSRIANACDGCKARKVRCDGRVPCSYCARRNKAASCRYSPQRRRRVPASASPALRGHEHRERERERGHGDDDDHDDHDDGSPATEPRRHSPGAAAAAAEDETDVPREARLVCDAQGKLIFIGDCAPLSFFQSVRQLVTRSVAQAAFAPGSSRSSVLENAPPTAHSHHQHSLLAGPPRVNPVHIPAVVARYRAVTAGLADLFDGEQKLVHDLHEWARAPDRRRPDDTASIVNHLVFAIGMQTDDKAASQTHFEHARERAYADLSGNLGVGTVQAFLLITVYMLCSCQINGAFLFFGVAVRAAYTVGLHRTEVNARFGEALHAQRDRLWKSLRVVDLFLSTSMGRPPATSDVDCTVPYHARGECDEGAVDVLNASVQILLIIEDVVVKIYSRRKISLQLTEGISRQLRDWSMRWLRPLKTATLARNTTVDRATVSGACQVLSSYYYAVMLVSRPFLMYELRRRLEGEGHGGGNGGGRLKLADACIDAASLMVELVLELMERRVLDGRMPLLVSWLFASSLVLGVGLLGGFGRILEKYTRRSIQALDYFSQHDAHATQYSLIAQSLLVTALEHLEKQEMREHARRTESSSLLFGLVPDSSPVRHREDASRSDGGGGAGGAGGAGAAAEEAAGLAGVVQGDGGLEGMDVFAGLGLAEDGSILQTPEEGGWEGTVNLFPLLDAGGGIDLAHYL